MQMPRTNGRARPALPPPLSGPNMVRRGRGLGATSSLLRGPRGGSAPVATSPLSALEALIRKPPPPPRCPSGPKITLRWFGIDLLSRASIAPPTEGPHAPFMWK